MRKVLFLISIISVISIRVFAQTPTYKIYALRYGSLKNATPTTVWALHAPKNDTVQIDFAFWLIKGDNGKNILVDAGFLKDIPESKEFGIVNYVRPDSMLMRVGLRAENITDIILSHPHWDHIDGISLFPNAHIWIQKDDYNYFVGTDWQKDAANSGFNKRDVAKMMELNQAGKVTLVNGDDQQLFPGITVYTGSRHTFNSQYVLVKTGADRVILASDNIWIYYSLDHMISASIGGTLDTAGHVRAMQRMKTLASDIKYIIPGHDREVFSRFPKVAEGVVRIR